MSEQWMLQYEECYWAANKRRAKVVPLGDDWYHIVGVTNRIKARRRREIEAMTKTLQARLSEKRKARNGGKRRKKKNT